MTRRQSDLIARAVREMDLRPEDRAYVAQQLATALATTNTRFDRGRFITAACPACQKMPVGVGRARLRELVANSNLPALDLARLRDDIDGSVYRSVEGAHVR